MSYAELIEQARAAGVPLNVEIVSPPMTETEFVRFYKEQALAWKQREYELLARIDRLERQARGEGW